MLLDERSSGLRARETDELVRYLATMRSEHGVAILVVEHDMSFVMDLCDYLYVLDFGKLIAEGTPDEVRRDPAVQAAYLGEEIEDSDAAVAGS